MNPDDFLASVQREAEARQNAPNEERVFVEQQFQSIAHALGEAVAAMQKFIGSHHPTTSVDNFPSKISTPDVVDAVKKLEKTLKPAGNADVVKVLKSLQDEVKKLPKAMPTTDKVQVSNLNDITDRLSKDIGSLLSAIKAQDLKPQITVPTPKVTVQPTPVTVQPTDVEGIIKALARVKKAVDEKPIPIANTPTDPLIKYNPADIDDAGSVQYFGYTDNMGAWYIKKFDTSTSPKTIRYSFGQSNYATNFTNRASLTYTLWGS